MKTKQRLISLLLFIAMLFSFCPTTVFAEAVVQNGDSFTAALKGLNETATTPSNIALLTDNNDLAIMSGASHLKGTQGSNVYYGNYYQSDTSGQTKEPVKWQVLKNADGRLFLLADQNLDVQRYHKEFVDVTWENCDLRQWLNSDFYNAAFSEKEKESILEIINKNTDTVDYSVNNQIGKGGEDTKDKVFLLSYDEYWKTSGYFKSLASRIGTNTAYVAAGGTIKSSTVEGVGEPNRWWLRSPSNHGNNYALYVMSGKEEGDVSGYPNLYGDIVSSHLCAVRPAFNLNLDAVRFSSAAAGGKPEGGLQAVEDYTGNEWKLTLEGSSRGGFTASKADDHTITYSGAQTGANEYISALIADGTGAYTHYGRLKNLTDIGDANGNVDVILPFDMTDKTLYIFNEQYNGDYKTDYASKLIPIDLAKNAYTITNNLTHLTSDNSATYYMTADSVDYTATLSPNNGYLPPENITITVDGKVLTATEYTYENGALTIPRGNITGDIIISASAKGIDAKPPIFTASPQGASYTIGNTAIPLSVAASVNDGGTLSYQWYSNTTDDNISGSAISGATGSIYTPLTTAEGTIYYYCVVTNTNSNATGAKTATTASDTAKIEVTAAITPSTKYTVTIQNDGNGTASAAPASAAAGTAIALTATANSGYHFKEWRVVSGNVTLSGNSFTMPAENVMIKAIFAKDLPQPVKHSVTIKGSYAAMSGAGNYEAGATVAIHAGSRGDYHFNGWSSSDGISFTDAARVSTTFIMPDKPVTITAAWSYAGESSSDGSYDGGYDDSSTTDNNKTTDEPNKDNPKTNTNTPDTSTNVPDTSASNPFTDVNETDWFYQDVMFVYEKGLLSDTNTTAFAPNSNATRAQLAVLFYRMENSPKVRGENSFIDVVYGSDTAWYYDAVTWAEKNGIMNGYGNGSFGPDDPITREQLAAIFHRYAQYKGYNVTTAGNLDHFTDKAEISPWAQETLNWAVGIGLMSGTAENQLSPQKTAARAQIAAMLHRFIANK